MVAAELKELVSLGETSKVQFKEVLTQAESMSRESVAMANSLGGMILVGIEDKTRNILGLSPEQLEYADRKAAEYADNVKPPVYITTEAVKVESSGEPKYVLIINIDKGINRPYKTPQGEIYVKQGSNKRLLTDNAEIARLFQQGANLSADEMAVYGTSVADVDERLFAAYFKSEFNQSYEEKKLTFEQALKAKKALRDGQVTLAGLLFFGKEPQTIKPAFTIKAVSFFGNDISSNEYRNKPTDFLGTIPELFRQGMMFLNASLLHLQKERDFNSKGVLEVSEIALSEVLQNALIHRDYYKNAPVRLLIFDNRIEIISPGKLPNSLTVDEARYGNPVIRNNQIAAFSSRTLPYSGLGSGLRRAFENQSNMELINDIEGEQFIVRIPRPVP
jgi:predicted HTH transcriptional regulator